tara:strand:+ start:240 stop:443 length:204 start_codon:yes stop_codon:yes gene_type:complete
MTSSEFTIWLHGYLEALETEGIEKIKITNIREKMGEIRNTQNQERVVFGPNVKRAEQQGYVNPNNNR